MKSEATAKGVWGVEANRGGRARIIVVGLIIGLQRIMLVAGSSPLSGSSSRTSLQPSPSRGGGGAFCQNDMFQASCSSHDQVIMMTSARYGRMEFNTCIERDYGYLGCDQDVLPTADMLCSGRRSCTIPVPNSYLDEFRPCPNDLKSYLTTEYICLDVHPRPHRPTVCRSKNPALVLESQSGYLPSVLTEEDTVGSADCPWIIRAKPGQRINVTLIDFATAVHTEGPCRAYAILRETSPPNTHTVCSNNHRQQGVYVSRSHELELRLLTGGTHTGTGSSAPEANRRHFLLHYNVFGCPNPPKPLYGWVKRSGDEATLGCLEDDMEWRMTCEQERWVGTMKNCTDGVALAAGLANISFGLSLGIIIAIAIAIGLVILTIGLFFLRWSRENRAPPMVLKTTCTSEYHTTMSYPHGAGTGSGASIPEYNKNNYHHQPPPHHQPHAGGGEYHSPENEYAYISEVPPLLSNHNGTGGGSLHRTPGDMGHHSDSPPVGTPLHVAGGGAISIPAAHGAGYGSMRGVCHVDHTPSSAQLSPRYVTEPDPPKYFELDPSGATRGAGTACKQLPVHERVMFSNCNNSAVPPPPRRVFVCTGAAGSDAGACSRSGGGTTDRLLRAPAIEGEDEATFERHEDVAT